MPQQYYFWLFCLFVFMGNAQNKLIIPPDAKTRIPFEWKSNLIIIPVSIQGVEMKFLVDTGVGHTLLFDNHKAQQLGLKQDHPYLLRGLGDQPALSAYKVKINQLKIGDLFIQDLTLLVLPESEFILSKRIGTHIDGIIGYDLFQHYPVLINYPRKFLHINPHKVQRRWKKKNSTRLPFHLHKRKPYVNLKIQQAGTTPKEGVFLLDTGLSDALWLFSKDIAFEKTPPVFEDFLGTGINGDVYGERGKMAALFFGGTQLNQLKVAYPNPANFATLSLQKNRLGSVGAELLSRFKILFDYPNKQLMIRRGVKTQAPFYYNLSGMEIAYDGVQLVKQRLPSVQRVGETGNEGIAILLQDRYQLSFQPVLRVTYVRPASPAYEAGIMAGDVLWQINGKKTHHMKMEKVLAILQKAPGDRIKLRIKRGDSLLKFNFRLQSIFATKPSL